MDGTYIGPQLKAARKLRGITNALELAQKIDRAGFGEKVIGQVERNQRVARDYEVQWLTEALDLPAAFFTDPPPAERPANGANGAELAQDTALADALARFTDAIRTQNKLLDDQTAVLTDLKAAMAEIRSLLGTDTTIRDETREATQRLLETVAAASPTLRDDAQSRAASPSPRDR